MSALSFLKDSVFSDEYAGCRGFLQARDTRFKVAIIFLLLLAVLFSKNIYFLILLYMLCLFLAMFSKISLGFFLKRTWIFIPLFSFFIALPALLDIFSPGRPVLSFNLAGITLRITQQGIAGAVFFFVRVLTSVSLAALLVLTTRHYALLKALRIFRVPQIFVMTMGMCYRYVYLFIEIIENTYLAIKSRVGFVHSVKKGQMIVAVNIAGLWQRSYILHDRVYSAMLSRGYCGEPKAIDEFNSDFKDWISLTAAILLFSAGLLWQSCCLS